MESTTEDKDAFFSFLREKKPFTLNELRLQKLTTNGIGFCCDGAGECDELFYEMLKQNDFIFV